MTTTASAFNSASAQTSDVYRNAKHSPSPHLPTAVRLAAWLVLLGVMVGCASADKLPAASGIPDLSAYRLGIGDRVRVAVFGEPDLSIEAVVDPTGHINYPLLGSVPALNKTGLELERSLASGLANGFLVSPDVRVSVVQYRPFYVIGQVKRAGAYPFVVGLTVEKALALAGGLTNLASTRRIYLLREASATQERLRADLDTLVLPGDTLMVDEGLF